MKTDPAKSTSPFSFSETCKRTLSLLIQCFKPIVIYGLGASLVIGMLLAPALVWLIHQGIRLFSHSVVLNYDLLAFFLTFPGILATLAWSFVITFLLLIYVGGPIVIMGNAVKGHMLSLGQVVQKIYRIFPLVCSFASIKVALVFFLFIPIGTVVWTLLSAIALMPIGTIEFHDFMPDNFIDKVVLVPVLVFLALVVLYYHIRWIFIGPLLCLSKLRLSAAYKISTDMVRGRFWTIAKPVLLLEGCLTLFFLLESYCRGGFSWFILTFLDLDGRAGFTFVLFLLLFMHVLVSTIAMVLAIAFTAGFITLLAFHFFEQRHRDEIERLAAFMPSFEESRFKQRVVVAGLAVALTVGCLSLIPNIKLHIAQMKVDAKITAHRAGGNTPENTLAGIRQSIAEGADYAEIDVLETKDGELAVLHDVNLERIAGVDRNVHEMDLCELQELDVGKLFDPSFTGEKIPTLRQVIEAAGDQLRLNIELKTHGQEKKLAESAVNIIHETGITDHCVVTSLEYSVLEEVRALDPTIRTGIVITAFSGDPFDIDIDFYSVQPLVGTASFILAAHRHNREVHVWTLNNPVKVNLVVDRGADNIITDYPAMARETIEARTKVDEMVGLFRRVLGQ